MNLIYTFKTRSASHLRKKMRKHKMCSFQI
jgi:hypothetical protein